MYQKFELNHDANKSAPCVLTTRLLQNTVFAVYLTKISCLRSRQ